MKQLTNHMMSCGPLMFVLGAVLLTASVVAHARGQKPDGIVAKVGDAFISEDEFLRRFELMPWPNRSRVSHVEESKREVLYSIIAEKVLAREAAERNLDQDTLFQQLMLNMKNMLARDQLYREEISSRVVVSEKEINDHVRRALKQILVSFIYCPADSDARFVRSLIHSAADFDRLRIDTSYAAGRDTATVIWGNGDPAIEDAAYRLKPGQISPVIAAGPGYYILKLDNATPSAYFGAMKPDVLRERVLSAIRSRREAVRLDEYLGEVLGGKQGYSIPGPFRTLYRALYEVFQKSPQDSLISFTAEMLNDVRNLCSGSLNDTITVAGERTWTLHEIATLLCEKSFSVPRPQLSSLPRRLNDEIKNWVQQELLAEEALRRGMDLAPDVRAELDRWSQFYLAAMMKSTLMQQVRITPEEFSAFVKSSGDTANFPLVQIREIRTRSVDEMHSAIEEIQQGTPFADVAATWSRDPEAKKRQGLSPLFPAYDHPPIGELAAGMNIGERYGPVQTLDGVYLFELVAKSAPARADSGTAERLANLRSKLVVMKERRALNQCIAQGAEKDGYTIYEDRLSSLKVSTVPMVTFRYLGFGGRIFAVPFLERQIDWLNVRTPSTQSTP